MKSIKRFLVMLIVSTMIPSAIAYLEGGAQVIENDPENGCVLEGPFDWQAFSEATSDMAREYGGRVVMIGTDDSFRSGRIIVKVIGGLPDIAAYHPVKMICDTEDHYVIQFLSDREASDCMSFLEQQPTVDYAEPDFAVSIDSMHTDGIH